MTSGRHSSGDTGCGRTYPCRLRGKSLRRIGTGSTCGLTSHLGVPHAPPSSRSVRPARLALALYLVQFHARLPAGRIDAGHRRQRLPRRPGQRNTHHCDDRRHPRSLPGAGRAGSSNTGAHPGTRREQGPALLPEGDAGRLPRPCRHAELRWPRDSGDSPAVRRDLRGGEPAGVVLFCAGRRYRRDRLRQR